jgi:hypothetical protein
MSRIPRERCECDACRFKRTVSQVVLILFIVSVVVVLALAAVKTPASESAPVSPTVAYIDGRILDLEERVENLEFSMEFGVGIKPGEGSNWPNPPNSTIPGPIPDPAKIQQNRSAAPLIGYDGLPPNGPE